MRGLLVALGLMASISGALAQEYELPTLRGSEPFVPAASPCCLRWGGFYAGGQLGAGITSFDFGGSTADLVAHMLRELALESVVHPSAWQVLGKTDTRGTSFGAFLGYNIGWESVILGFELSYSRMGFTADAPVSPITRVTPPAGGNTYLVTITGSGSMRITDVATFRARGGWEISNFLPYAFIGAAVGRADLARSATVSGQENPADPCGPPVNPTCTPFSFTETEAKKGAFIYGWTLGAGFDMMVMPGVFLRAEYEYVAFQPIWEINAAMQTGRLGVGLKF